MPIYLLSLCLELCSDPWPQICSAYCHYIFQHTLTVCEGRGWHSYLTARWALAHQGVPCLQGSQTGSRPHRYTWGQIVKGGHEHEVGNGWVTNSCLIRRWLQIDHVLILIASGACARYWPHLTINDHLPTKFYLIHASINSYKRYTSHYCLEIGTSSKSVHKISQHIMTQYILLL